jgi:hypothetical protein
MITDCHIIFYLIERDKQYVFIVLNTLLTVLQYVFP